MGERSRSVLADTQSLSAGVSGQRLYEVVPPRAEQVVRLLGYRLGISNQGDFSASGEIIMGGFLQAIETDWNIFVADMFVPDLITNLGASRQAWIDCIWWEYRVEHVNASGQRVTAQTNWGDWAVCDILVPGLWFYSGGILDVTANFQSYCVVEYEYIRAGAGLIAAVNNMWGRSTNPAQ